MELMGRRGGRKKIVIGDLQIFRYHSKTNCMILDVNRPTELNRLCSRSNSSCQNETQPELAEAS